MTAGKILIVDDNNEQRSRVKEILEMENFEVFGAADGLTGIKCLRTCRVLAGWKSFMSLNVLTLMCRS